MVVASRQKLGRTRLKQFRRAGRVCWWTRGEARRRRSEDERAGEVSRHRKDGPTAAIEAGRGWATRGRAGATRVGRWCGWCLETCTSRAVQSKPAAFRLRAGYASLVDSGGLWWPLSGCQVLDAAAASERHGSCRLGLAFCSRHLHSNHNNNSDTSQQPASPPANLCSLQPVQTHAPAPRSTLHAPSSKLQAPAPARSLQILADTLSAACAIARARPTAPTSFRPNPLGVACLPPLLCRDFAHPSRNNLFTSKCRPLCGSSKPHHGARSAVRRRSSSLRSPT